MNLPALSRKLREWYHLGGTPLVFKGVYTKFERAAFGIDESESTVTITLNGREYRVSKGEPVHRWRQFERGVIMPEVKRPMDELLGPSDVFVDVGAAMGDTPLYAHSIIGDSGAVYAFEPDVFQFENLQVNIDHNSLDNIEIFNQAVGNQCGEVDPDVIMGQVDGGVDDEYGQIQTVTLDSFLTDRDIDPDLVKIDVDGAEDRVIEGGTDTVIGHRPVILELHHSDLLENRAETIELVFEHADEVTFLGAQGTSVTGHTYGDTLTEPADLDTDIVTNLLLT